MSNYRFDLEKAIAAWRRPFEHNRAFSEEDLEELEGSLRDRVAALVEAGLPEEAAFRGALRRMGSYGTAEAEYRKVYWGKRRRRRELLHELTWRGSMLKNYFKTAVRNLKRNPGYSFINLSGLAVGVACCLFLLLYVRDELSYDRYHDDADAIYRVNLYVEQLGTEVGVTPTIVAPLFLREFPEIRAATRLEAHGGVIQIGEQVFDEDAFYFADSTFFQVFTHRLLRGDPRTALNRPNTVVLTASTARKYFGDVNPLGRTLLRNSDQEFEVTGVMEDVPAQSHYHFDFLASFASRERWASTERWDSANFFTFIRLHDGTSEAALKPKMDALLARLRAAGDDPRPLTLEPLTDIHLRTDVAYDLDATGDVTYVYGFATIALLILLIACINFMNLATARSARRAKEVGMRKTLGALRGQLIRQFYSESALLTLGGLLLAVALVALGLPWFNALSGKALAVGDLLAPKIGLLMLVIFFVVSLVAGSYPAVYLSHFEPVRVLRGRVRAGRGIAWLRQGLVVLQFGISALLIVGTLVVMHQLRFVGDQHLGFDKEHIVTLRLNDPNLREHFPAMEEALRGSPYVAAAAAVSQIPGQLGWTSGFHAEGLSEEDEILVKGMPAAAAVADALGLEVIAGRPHPKNPPLPDSVSYQFLLNETALRRLGWTPDDAIGRRVAVDSRGGEVIGVVKDFHYRSLREAIEPLAIWYEPSQVGHLLVRLSPGDIHAAMAHLETVWKRFAPQRPFSYRFLDDVYDQLYRNEQQLGQIVAVFAFLAIFVACLGLFGLASFTAQQRTKEIGVRKVLGATVPGLVALLSKDFLRLVALAFLVATPAAYFLAQRWLDGFAYRIDLSVWTFVVAGVAALGIALLTVGYQAVKAALADPVQSLRYE